MKSSREWQLGQWGEKRVRRYLEESGKFVVPTTCIADGGAPALTRLLYRYVLPDFQAFGDGSGEWWEVKTKTKALLYQKQNEYRTGIGERHWNEYIKVANTTGLPGWLAMLHQNPPELRGLLLAAPFSDLRPFPHIGSTAAHREQMVWFRIDNFKRLKLGPAGPELPAPPHIEPKTVHPWDRDKPIGPPQPTLPFDDGGEEAS